MRKLKLVLTLVLIFVMVASLSACGGGKAKNTGKTIVMARPMDSDNLDPVIQDGNVNIWVFNLVMETLVKTDAEGTKNDLPGLATEWKVAPDKKSITFTLRQGVKFSDGTNMTADDVVFSLERARTTKASPWLFALEAVEKTEKVDASHVKVSLKSEWSPIFADLAMFNVVITSKAYFEKVGAQAYSQKPIGTGPFMFVEWKKGEYILLKRNPYYWQKGKPLVDEIKITVVPDDNTRIMQLQSGAIDMMEFVPFSRVVDIQKDPNLNMILVPSTSTTYIGFNNSKPPFNDPKVRNAMAYGTDKAALIKTILFGNGYEATSFMPKAGPMWNPNIKSKPYDAAKAKQMLAEAGYPDGFKTEIAINPARLNDVQIATVLKDQWARIGVELTVKQLDAATLRTYTRGLQYQVSVGGWTNDIVDSSQITEYMTNPTVSRCFWTGWEVAKDSKQKQAFDLAVKAKSELDNAKRQELYYQIQQLVDDDMPRIPIYHTPYLFATRKTITGFVQTPLGNYWFENLDKVTK